MLSEASPLVTAAQVEAIHRAATAYVATTAQQIQETSLVPSPQIRPVIDRIYERANTVRARQMVLTETHRMTQAAQQAAWQDTGDVSYKTWRVQSDHPCSFCEALDGTRISIEQAFFLKGHTMLDGTGRRRVLDYDDIYHPPLHPACACVLESQ